MASLVNEKFSLSQPYETKSIRESNFIEEETEQNKRMFEMIVYTSEKLKKRLTELKLADFSSENKNLARDQARLRKIEKPDEQDVIDLKLDKAMLDSDDSDYYDPDLGKWGSDEDGSYLPPLLGARRIPSRVPVDSIVQLKA